MAQPKLREAVVVAFPQVHFARPTQIEEWERVATDSGSVSRPVKGSKRALKPDDDSTGEGVIHEHYVVPQGEEVPDWVPERDVLVGLATGMFRKVLVGEESA
jgi:hypothetical protein